LRVIAIITYTLAGLLGLIALVFGYWDIGMIGAYILLFGIAFHRIAALQGQLPLSTAPFPRRSGALQTALFSSALLAFVAAFVTRRPQLVVVAIYLALFGCLFCGLASLRNRVERSQGDPPRISDRT
jgi:hypothetical protein